MKKYFVYALASLKIIGDGDMKEGMKTIAEFVASEEIFKAVCDLGIDYAQGYFISPPVPQDQLRLS